MATFRTFSDFQNQTRATVARDYETQTGAGEAISKNRHKKIAAPAPDIFDPGRRASLFMYSGPGVYVQDVTQSR